MWLDKLVKSGVLSFSASQKFILSNCQYETIGGSFSYGVSGDTSDTDIVGFCIPPKNMIFPHIDGHILGFGKPPQRFDQWQKHHIQDGNKQYDFTIYNIVKFFNLCLENNPNMVDALFVPLRCITHSTEVGNLVRENRKLFLHKGSWHKFRGYAFSQLHKANSKNRTGKRKAEVEKYGYDPKFLSHVVRLMDECEQILMFGDIDLERSRDYQKAIRRGDVGLGEVQAHFTMKEVSLERLYHESNAVPHRPDEEAIKTILLKCLEHHYGNLNTVIVTPSRDQAILNDLSQLLEKYL